MRILFILLLLLQPCSCIFGVCSLQPCSKKLGKIDVVYTWVDGADPAWQKRFGHALKTNNHPILAEAARKCRFRSRDELKYSLRSVWKYAPFVNHIYIVTSNQTPKWLKPHPKITVIDHEDIFLSEGDLPTFNSQAIEANLHHIPDLKECYIYFNDDVFLGATVKPHDFFSDSGKPKIFLAPWITPDGAVEADDASFEASWKNTNELLNRLFGNKERYALEHAPFAFRRSQQQSLEDCMPGVFKKVSSHTFRTQDDVVITAGFSQYYLENYNLVKRSSIECQVIGLNDDLEANRQALHSLEDSCPTTFCIEDAMLHDSIEQDLLLHSFFERYFPEPAPWELK